MRIFSCIALLLLLLFADVHGEDHWGDHSGYSGDESFVRRNEVHFSWWVSAPHPHPALLHVRLCSEDPFLDAHILLQASNISTWFTPLEDDQSNLFPPSVMNCMITILPFEFVQHREVR